MSEELRYDMPRHLAEAAAFAAKHDLHPAIPLEEISELMGLAELGLLPNQQKQLCPGCARKHGEDYCWGNGCQCSCDEAVAKRERDGIYGQA